MSCILFLKDLKVFLRFSKAFNMVAPISFSLSFSVVDERVGKGVLLCCVVILFINEFQMGTFLMNIIFLSILLFAGIMFMS